MGKIKSILIYLAAAMFLTMICGVRSEALQPLDSTFKVEAPAGYSVVINDEDIPLDLFSKYLGRGVEADNRAILSFSVYDQDGGLAAGVPITVSGFSFSKDDVQKYVFFYDGASFGCETAIDDDTSSVTISPGSGYTYIFAGLRSVPINSGLAGSSPDNYQSSDDSLDCVGDSPIEEVVVTEKKWPVDENGEIDLSTMPPIRDQGDEGLCWVFSAVATAEMSLIKEGYSSPNDVDLSELATAYEYRNKYCPTKDMGLFLSEGGRAFGVFSPDRVVVDGEFVYTQSNRAYDEYDLPYSKKEELKRGSSWVDLGTSDIAIEDYVRDFYNNESVRTIKTWIKKYGAVTEAYSVNLPLYFDYNHNSYYMPSSGSEGMNHEVVIVGWDDEFPRENFKTEPEGDGAWLIRNSWGYDDFGASGYFWMSYYDKYACHDCATVKAVPAESDLNSDHVEHIYINSQDGCFKESSVTYVLSPGDVIEPIVATSPSNIPAAIEWSTSDTSRAIVDDGVVAIPLNAPCGKALLTAACGGAKAYMAIYVRDVGKCGDDLTYAYDPLRKSLVIEGVGRMYDYGENSLYGLNIPNCDEAKYIEIKDGCTYIGSYAFCSSRTVNPYLQANTFIMPDSVSEIGERGVYYLRGSNPKTFRISKNLKTIQDYGLNRIYGVVGEIVFLDGLEYVGDGVSFPSASSLSLPGTLSEAHINLGYGWDSLATIKVVKNTYSEEWVDKNVPNGITIERIYVPAESVAVSATTTEVAATKTLQLTASTLPAGNSEQKPAWNSSDDKIATVSDKGVVTGVSEGTVTITATAHEGLSSSINLTILPAPALSLNSEKETIKKGQTFSLSATELADTETEIIWKSGDESTATVDSNGLVTGVKAGETTITATTLPNGYTASCVITVTPIKIENIVFDEYNVPVEIGKTRALSLTIIPSNADDVEITWMPRDDSIATVEDGVVTGVSEGATIITASAKDGSTAVCVVRVIPVYPASISVTKETSLYITDETTLDYAILPSGASMSGGELSFESSDPAVARIDRETGAITPVTAGSTTLTVKYEGKVSGGNDGTLSDTCLLTVSDKAVHATSLSLTATATEFSLRDAPYTAALKIELTPDIPGERITDPITWKSGNPAVAEVLPVDDNSADILTKAVGTTEIIVTCGTLSKSVNITVKGEASEVIIKPDDDEEVEDNTIELGDTKRLSVSFAPAIPSNINLIQWTTSDKKVLSVKNGVVTANKVGRATITASVGSVRSSVELQVVDRSPMPNSVKGHKVSTKKTVKMNVGKIVTLAASLSPAKGFLSANVMFSSTDPTKVSVRPVADSKGQYKKASLTALAPGVVYITAEARGNDGITYRSVTKVIVKKPATAGDLTLADSAGMLVSTGTDGKGCRTYKLTLTAGGTTILDPSMQKLVTDSSTIKFSGGGAYVSSKNGVLTAKKSTYDSKKSTDKPVKITVSCGKAKAYVYVTVR